MLEVSTESEATQQAMPFGVFRSATPQARSRPAINHWSQRVKDPLGKALLRLHGQRDILDLMESAVPAVEKVQPVVEAPDVAVDDSTESIFPLQQIQTPSLVEPSSGSERRRFPRRQSECSVTLVERAQTLELTPRETDWLLQSSRAVGQLLDISQTGLCLLVEKDLAIGSEVLLRISNPQLQRTVDSAATVVRSQPSGAGRFSIHCVVLREFTLDQLQDLGRPQISNHVLA